MASSKRKILGGGSNILFRDDFDGLIIYNNLLGMKIIPDDEDNIIVEAAAGEDWHSFVITSYSIHYTKLYEPLSHGHE